PEEEVVPSGTPEVSVLSQVLTAFAGLTVSWASFLLTVLLGVLSESPLDFFVLNRTPIGPRVVSVACAWGGGALIALLLLLVARKAASPRAFRLAALRRSAPLVVSCFLPPLFTPN